MATIRSSTLRQLMAAVLLVALTFSGVGRMLALGNSVPGPSAGVAAVAQICHSGSKPSGPGHQDCLDFCALCAPASLPGAAPFAAPIRVEHFAEHADNPLSSPVVAATPTPRMSQGPPAA